MKLPRFHLRDLFWLVLVCALAAGWWLDRWQLRTWQDPYNQLMEKLHRQDLIMLDRLERVLEKEGYEVVWTDLEPSLEKLPEKEYWR